MKKVIAVLFAGLVATTGLVAMSQPAQAQCGVGNNWQAKHYRQMQKRAIKQYRRSQAAANLNVYANPYINTSAYGYANPYANTSAYGYVDPYASAYTNAYANPYANTYGYPYGTGLNTGLGAGITSSVGATLLNSLLGGY
jgi:hypothetical protein